MLNVRLHLHAARAARRCSTGWRPQGAAGQSLHGVSASLKLLQVVVYHSAHRSRPCQCCHMRQSRCRVLPKRREGSRVWRRAKPCGRVEFCGVSHDHLNHLKFTALPSRHRCQMRADLAALPPAIRSSATKILPCRLPTAACAPLDDDAHRAARTTCADLSAFSSISRSRTPNADHCVFGLRLFCCAPQTGLQPARC